MLSACLRVLYLHGFASGPESRKARFFAERLGNLGVRLEIPDLAEGRFERLTITGQLEVINKSLRGDSAILIGSSLGGYVAALYAATHSEVKRVILLAPAFGFYNLWTSSLGPERLREWRENGSMRVYHHGEKTEVPIRYDLIRDAAEYPAFPDFCQSALIFHGLQDEVVPARQSSDFVREHGNVQLIELQSGHELTDALEEIWSGAKNFLFDPDGQFRC